MLGTSAQAYTLFFGEDRNGSELVPLTFTPNTNAAQADFLSNLIGVETETFEAFTHATLAPLLLSFSGAGTATLTGSGGINAGVAGLTNGFGRYATSGVNYWEAAADGSGNFTINFSNPIAAFGFKGIDIGDFAGNLFLGLSNGAQIPVPHSSGDASRGSVLFFGLIAESEVEQFTSLSFLGFGPSGMARDVFSFDDMTIGRLSQVVVEPPVEPPVTSVPEPAMVLGLAIVASLSCVCRQQVNNP
ncbi:MAG: PEP-CTERM sorting domain-containing protein [Leptolyngbya sp. RL_3_1]|nr:PEP-CTERM sorting domain-containing protein [Leptolyngbya sp. RL_3_1]